MSSIVRSFPKSYSQISGASQIGDAKMSFLNSDHLGWLVCDGRSLSTSYYNELFNAIQYTFGGSGNVFNLPDARGRIGGAIGTGPGPITYNIGDSIGDQRHRLTVDEMPTHTHVIDSNGLHTHSITDPGHTHSYTHNPTNTSVTGPTLGNTNVADDTNADASTTSSFTGITINSNGEHNHIAQTTGGSNYHNNMQPTLFMGNMFIYSGRVDTSQLLVDGGTYPYPY